jgi:hypothetical protein
MSRLQIVSIWAEERGDPAVGIRGQNLEISGGDFLMDIGTLFDRDDPDLEIYLRDLTSKVRELTAVLWAGEPADHVVITLASGERWDGRWHEAPVDEAT